MKQNKYDDKHFFEQYSQMARSVKGLSGAGEWHVLRELMPDFTGKRVLDLGCGFGWHAQYAIEQGAESVVGVDLSERMLAGAKEHTAGMNVSYIQAGIEDVAFDANSFDIVISSLAFHYIESFEEIARKVNQWLSPNGIFLFSVEHPVFTAFGSQDWIYDENQRPAHWPVDNYYHEGIREAQFLGETVIKYHKTLTTYVNGLLQNGFRLHALVEPEPDPAMLLDNEAMQDELRRPMFLIISAQKQ